MKIALIALAAAGSLLSCAAHAAPAVNLCTASESGKYYENAGKLHGMLKGKLAINPIVTNGSEDNLRRMVDGSCDAAFVQADASLYFSKTNPGAALNIETVTPIQKEYAHLVCNTDAGVDAIKDLYGTKKVVIIGKPGSGSAITWFGFGTAEKRYQPIPTSDMDGDLALTRLNTNRAQCMLFVAGLRSGTMAKINDLGKGRLKLVKLNDGDLDSAKDAQGKPLYRYEDIPGGTYANLQSGWFGSSVKTLTLDSILVVNASWIEKNGSAYGDLSTAAIRLSQQLGN
jgi:TRAP transporter TAXI family solute receptor